MLEIRNLNKTYGQSTSPALHNFNVRVEEGEFVSLIGPSGCGKTTALRIATGLLEPSTGEVFVDGKLSLGPARDKAMVFQLFNLLPWRTALENAAYGLELQKMKKAERLAKAQQVLELVGLGDRLGHYPFQLSGGQCQRVGLARALAIEPKLLLMDEPFGSLDALTRELLQGMLQDVCADKNLTVLFVTHSIDEAIFLSDRVVVMGVPGRVIGEFRVDLPRPRRDYDWRATPEYTQMRSEIWNLLEAEHATESKAA
jgi:NitT/TauT family transport system ATP-binding protein